MASAAGEHWRDEKINGVIYDMSPAPGYQHGIINNNINTIIKQGLKNSLCLVFMENLDFKYHPDINDDYLCPDIMVICNRKHLKGGAYSGVPKLIVETLSPSTAKKDRSEKMEIYEAAGVEEYWIVDPKNKIVSIYPLTDGLYGAGEAFSSLQTLRSETFPGLEIPLQEIFPEGM